MQLLIVHQDAEIGAGLLRLVGEYTAHTADFVRSNEAAVAWAEGQAECDLLLAQLDGDGLDGLALGLSLGEKYPRLSTFFLPAYPLSEQRLELAQTKIFPEPIDGERLRQAIERVAEGIDEPNSFQVVDLLQLCCLSGKSGALRLIGAFDTGLVFLRNGELRHAQTARSRGLGAIHEMSHWGEVSFAFDPNASLAGQTIDIGWDAALIEVVTQEREEQALHPDRTAEPEISVALLPPEPDLTGQEFGAYRVGRKLTESFWDQVYQAEQVSIGRPVALHVLRTSLRAVPERAQEFLDTASVNANICHPAILPVYEAGECDGTYFYAREFVVGRTVYEIKAGGLTITELLALRIVRAIADALAHLDDHQILHAPLRLSRIFVTPNDEVKLADVAVAHLAMAQLSPAQTEIQMIGRLLIPLTKATAIPGSGRVLKLIHHMQTSGDDAITAWAVLAHEAKKLETLLAPPTPLRAPKKTGALHKVRLWGKRG